MKQEWYILIDGCKEGPFTSLELKADSRITPDTLVWKEGFLEWIAIRFVPELKLIFKDEPESKPLHEDPSTQPIGSDSSSEQATLTIQEDPSQFFLWILLLILVLIYVFYQLNQ